jgi:DNA repair protein RadA/Sms
VAPVYEGSRILFVEIQSLVVPAKGGVSRVFSDRIDSRRVSRIAAVLEKHLKVPFSDTDIYVNVAGGIRVDEVAVDLALAVSLYSAKTSLALCGLQVVFGEVSLAGEIRRVPHIERRAKSCLEMGFNRVIGPMGGSGPSGRYRRVSDLKQAMRSVFGERDEPGVEP